MNAGSGIPKGLIAMWSGSAASIPQGWTLCDGKDLNGDGNPDVPDLRAKFIVGAVAEQNQTYSVGATGGKETHALVTSEMPSHNHSITDPGHYHAFNLGDPNKADSTDNTGTAYGDAWGQNTAGSYTGITVNSAGGGQPHENRPPYYALCFIMKL
jgi:microcystin-dependent protein